MSSKQADYFIFDFLRNSIADEPLILINHLSVIIFMPCCPERRDLTLRGFHAGFHSFSRWQAIKRTGNYFYIITPSSGDSPVHIQDKLINYLSPACVRQTTNNSLCFLSKDSVKDVFWNKSVRLPLWRFYPPVKIKSFRTGSNTRPVQICFWKLKHRLNYLIYNPDHAIMPWYWSLVKINNRIFTWPKR